MKIFFSYSRSDSDVALRLVKELKGNGIEVWLDQKDIRDGSAWDIEIENALHSADIIIALLTLNSVESQNVMDEVYYGLDEKKRIIPVILNKCRVPFRLRRLNFIDFSNNFDKGLARLISTLNIELGMPPSKQKPHTFLKKTKDFVSRNRIKAVITIIIALVAFKIVIGFRTGESKHSDYGDIDKVQNSFPSKPGAVATSSLNNDDSIKKRQLLKDSIKREEQQWTITLAQNTVASFKAYQKNFAQGVHYKESQEKIIALTKAIDENKKIQEDEMAWKQAIDQNTITAYKNYRITRPNGIHFDEANDRITALNPRFVHGQAYQGGIIFFIDTTGEHGLISAKEDLSVSGANWHTISKSIAAFRPEGFGDWRLPSKEELNLLFGNKNMLPGFKEKYYWSSTTAADNTYWVQHFGDGLTNSFKGKDFFYQVRLVREF